MSLLNHIELCHFIFFQDIFHKNSQTIPVNIRNRYVKYSKCGRIPLKKMGLRNEIVYSYVDKIQTSGYANINMYVQTSGYANINMYVHTSGYANINMYVQTFKVTSKH